jgi:hypothetical protein
MQTDHEECLQQAAKCLRMAEQFHGKHREALREIAQRWRRLAEEAAASGDGPHQRDAGSIES